MNPFHLTVAKLTEGERLRLARRRRGASQQAWADYCGVTLYRYRQWEADAEETPKEHRAKLGKLHEHEACFMLRVRSGIPLRQLARRLGVTPNWLCEIEHGRQPAGRLVAYWQKKLDTR